MADRLPHQVGGVSAFECAASERGDRGLLSDRLLEPLLRVAQALARAVERARGVRDPDLHEIEALGHAPDLVAAAHRDGLDVGTRVRGREVAAAERLHRPREICHGARREAAGGVRDLARPSCAIMPGKIEADADRQDRDRDEVSSRITPQRGIAVHVA